MLTSPWQAREVVGQLRDQGYTVAVAATHEDFRATQAEIARALRLPESAGRNLDALEDSLRDLPDLWEEPVALLWQDASRLVALDGDRWWVLAEILDAADLPVVAAREPRDWEKEELGR